MSGIIFPYLAATNEFGETGFSPPIPITLFRNERSIEAHGLVDTGATVNVLPYSVGLALGGVWNDNGRKIRLVGNLGRFEAQGILVSAVVGYFEPVELAFAWTEVDNAPLLLGQTNFLMAFDVCFYRSRLQLEVTLKSG